MSNTKNIVKRKKDHLKFALSKEAQIGSTGLDAYRFTHNALPEVDFDKIDTSTKFLGKKVDYPFFISCMTGGILEGKNINRNLAKAAQKHNIAMGVGSQRASIEYPELQDLFMAREVAPDIPLMANIGIVQLNYGFGLQEYQKCVNMIKADALVVHINPIQEIIQPEGDRNWEGLLQKLEKIVKKLSVPVIAKEVGFGLSEDVIKRLYNIGVKIFDTAGWGGTNWSYVEGMRGKADKNLGMLFSNWGIPSADSVIMAKKVKDVKSDITILGSGGIKNGLEIAKVLALGADMAGLAAPFGKAARKSSSEVETLISRLGLEFKTTMFGLGAKNIKDLKNEKLTT
jgi:isopentenyl-diphosphate Delta-isomerase